MGLSDLFKKKKYGPEFVYSEKEIDEIDRFIVEHFGNYSNVDMYPLYWTNQ